MNYSTRNKNKTVKFIIIHYTGMIDFKSAYKKLNNLNSDVSCHYLISRNGKIYNLLSTNLKAWHAGISKWKGYKGLNDYSIGIELENKGHEHGYENFTKKQYKSLNILLRGAAVRILVTRLHDTIYHPKNALVIPKDPKEYLKILEWHQKNTEIKL